jgi:hypothetical protein
MTDRSKTPRMRLPRQQRATLPPADEARLEPSTTELDRLRRDAQRAADELEQIAQDIDSDRMSMDGIVLAPLEDDDSLVISVKESLADLGHRDAPTR